MAGPDQSDSSKGTQNKRVGEGSSAEDQHDQADQRGQDGQKAQGGQSDSSDRDASVKVSAGEGGASKVEMKEVKIANDADLNARREEMRSMVKSAPGIPHAETSAMSETLTAAADNEVIHPKLLLLLSRRHPARAR